MLKKALTIAASARSGKAGIKADLKVSSPHGPASHYRMFFLAGVTFICWLFLSVLALNIYFVNDDFIFVERALDEGLFQILNPFEAGRPLNLYRPLTTDIYFWFFYHIFGLAPVPYHLANLVIMGINILMVAVLGKKLTGQSETGLWAALLYSVSILNFRIYAWISCIQDLAATCLMLFALLFFIKADEIKGGHARKRVAFSILGPTFFMLSLLAKESTIWLPLWLWIFDLLKGLSQKSQVRNILKSRFRRHMFFDLIMTIYFAFQIFILRLPNEGQYQLSLFSWHIFKNAEAYIYLTLFALGWPEGLLLRYFSAFLILAVIILAWIAVWQVRRKTIIVPVACGLIWFALGLSIFLTMVNSATRLYYISLPAIGLFWVVGFGVQAALAKLPPASAWLLTILLAALYLAGSYNNSLVRSENSWIIAVSKINNSLHDNLTKLHPKFPYGAKIVVIGIDEQEPRRIGVRALYRRPDLQIFLNGQGVQELRDGDHITLSKLPGFDYHNTYIFLVEETSLREFDLKPNSPENIIAVLQIKPK